MYSVENGQITANILYRVMGDKKIVYDGNEYSTGEFFRGIDGVKEFIFTGDGVGFLIEISEIKSGTILFKQTHNDLSFPIEATGINGMAIQFRQSEAEKSVNEVTKLQEMSITFNDHSFYTYFINETRFSFNPD